MKLDTKTVARLELPADKADAIHFDDAMPGFGFRLRRSGGQVRRSWIVQYRRVGGTRRILLGSAEVLSAETARAQAKKVLAKVALGEDPQAERIDTRAKAKFTLRAIADDYLAAKQTTVRPRTFTEAQRYLTGPYFKPLHNMPVDQIARRDVAARLLIIARESGSVTASRARTALSALFAWAMGEGLAQTNPVVGTNQPKEPPSRSRVLDDAELAAVWHACREDDIGRIVRLLMLTGARRSEVGGMAWCEIDLERGTWTIPGNRTKNHREHTLPLPALAQSIIASVPQMVNRDCLFGERASGGFTSWAHGKAAVDARVSGQVRPWTLHDLRRSVATGMATLGAQPHIIEQVLNHQSGHKAGIAGVYNRSPYEREVKAALALWADHLRTIIGGGERKVLTFPQDRA
jgi:integrase